MDMDTTRHKNDHEKIVKAFMNHEADILIGTQMIVKGHDFPEVTLVGALAADMSLFAADYRSAERTFQLLTQAVGRAGRAGKAGMAIIQTYHPEHYAIQAAAAQDYTSFYEQEIGYRQLMGYPPAEHMLAVHVSSAEEEKLDMAMAYLKRFLERIMPEKEVQLIGVEAAGLGVETGKHAAAMALGEPGTLHGMRSYLLQDEDGNIQLAHSISAGLDYPGVGPEHAYLRDSGRAQYVSITDKEAMDALMELCELEGIIPAIESAHVMAYAFKKAKEMRPEQSMIVCLSGRGDKDVNTIANYLAGKGYLN